MFDQSGVARDADGIKRYERLPASLVDLLRGAVDTAADREAVVELDGPRVTYRQLWDSCARVAGGLREAGVRPGDRVAIRYGNGLDWVRAFFGTLMAGAVAVPVNTRLVEREVDHVVRDSDAAVVLSGALPDGACFVGPARDPAAIFYTSGTTGSPKGAVLTHENFLTNAENGLRVSGLPRADPEMRNLVSVPLFHVAACNSQLIPTVQIAGTTVIMPAFDVDRFLRAIVEERIRVVSSAPAVYWRALHHPEFARYDVSGVGWATYGGAPVAPALVRRIRQGFPEALVGNGFGLTETSSLSTYLPDADALTHADSVGFAAPTVDVALAEPGTVSELLIRGANVVGGYWRNPAATAAAFRDGWLRTGDLARIDDAGRVYLVDRLTDMINRGGENVYCVEVENVLAGAPGVFEVAVFGVPDEVLGETVAAVVVPAPGRHADPDAILDHARDRLARFKVPQHLRISTEPLPRNAAGKVRKDLLR